MRVGEMSESQAQKFATWAEEQEKKTAEKQGKEQAYYGAIGGAYTYSYTPTGLGVVFKVRHNLTLEEVDLTDYSEW